MHKAHSFEEAEKFDKDYYMRMRPEERLETVQFLRDMYFKFKRPSQNESGKGLRRFITIIQQK